MRLNSTVAKFLLALAMLTTAAWAADKPQVEKFPDAISKKDEFLSDRSLYDRRVGELLLARPEALQDAANRGSKPFIVHLGLDRSLIDGLELVELRFEDSNRQSRVFAAQGAGRAQLRWLSFRFEHLRTGTKLFQVRLRYHGDGKSYDRWGVATLLEQDLGEKSESVDATAEAYFSLNRNFRDLSQVALTQIDIDKPFAEAPASGQAQPDRRIDFFFFRPKRGLQKIGDSKKAIVPPTGLAASANASAKTSKFFDPLKALIEKQMYSVALDCLTVSLASLQSRPFQQHVRLFVIKSLLESVTGDLPGARLSIRHAEELFWSRAPQRPESWDQASAQVFFSLSLAKQDIERLKFL